MSNRGRAAQDALEQALFPEVDQARPAPERPAADANFGLRTLRAALAHRSHRSLDIAERALTACPVDPDLLLLAALTATASGKPDRSLALLKRYSERYRSSKAEALLRALAPGEQDQHALALTILRADKLESDQAARDTSSATS